MKGNKKSFVMGFLTAVILLGLAVPALAAGSYAKWDNVFVGVSIVIDGETLEPKDVNGNIVDAVIYEGTTYLPVRAVAQALGAEVGWDQETRTVYLDTGKPAEAPEQNEPEPDAPPQGEDAYVGTYRFSSVDGISAELYAEYAEIEPEEARNLFVLELLPEGKALFTVDGETLGLTWSVEGETLYLTAEEETVEATILDGSITLVVEDSTLVMSR